jgi:peptide deformylase
MSTDEPVDLCLSPLAQEPVELPVEQINLNLSIWPDPGLKQPVGNFPEADLGSPLVRQTAEQMIAWMKKLKGIGLAAQQVGIPFRIFVMQKDEESEPRVFLNPRIIEAGDKWIQVTSPGEGCLSFPYGYRQPVPRHDRVRLQWQDFEGVKYDQWFEGSEAIIVQHEVDHLNGFCFIDRLSWVKRDMAIRKARSIRARYKKGMRAGVAAMKNAPRTPEFNRKRLQIAQIKENTDAGQES